VWRPFSGPITVQPSVETLGSGSKLPHCLRWRAILYPAASALELLATKLCRRCDKVW